MNDLEREISMLEGIDISQGQNQPVTAQAPVQSVQQTPVQQVASQPVTQQTYVQAPYQQPVIQPMQQAQAVQQPQYAAPVQTLNLDVAQQQVDETDYSLVSMGKKVSANVIEKFKSQKDERKRVIILMPFFDNKDPLKASSAMTTKSHYSEDLGYSFLCFGGECCQYENRVNVRYLFPIIEIPLINNDINNPVPTNMGGHLKMKLLAAGNELYSQLCDIYANNESSFDNIDLVMTCTEQQYQKFTVQATKTTLRGNYASELEQLKQKWTSIRDQAYTVVARKIDREYYLTQKGLNYTGTAVGETAPSLDSVIGS